MYRYSIDEKRHIIDNWGNEIVDLTQSMFNRQSRAPIDYDFKQLSEYFSMRPDLVSFAEYGTIDKAEIILKFTGISNPFSLDKDDVVMVPAETQINGVLLAENPDLTEESAAQRIQAVRNYYKFVNQDYKSDSTSYDQLEKMKIASGVLNPDEGATADYIVPYISDTDTQAITIRNGRVYFGEDSGMQTANMINASSTSNIDQQIQALIDSTATALSDTKCMYNGVTLGNFVRATLNSNTSQ